MVVHVHRLEIASRAIAKIARNYMVFCVWGRSKLTIDSAWWRSASLGGSSWLHSLWNFTDCKTSSYTKTESNQLSPDSGHPQPQVFLRARAYVPIKGHERSKRLVRVVLWSSLYQAMDYGCVLEEENRKRVIERLKSNEDGTGGSWPREGLRDSAVLVPLLKVDGEPSVLFQVRARNLSRHRNQVRWIENHNLVFICMLFLSWYVEKKSDLELYNILHGLVEGQMVVIVPFGLNLDNLINSLRYCYRLRLP